MTVTQVPQAELGRRYVRLLSEPRPPDEIRSTIDELVAGDHVAYGTSWGTLLGRRALKNYVEVSRAAFPSFTYRITGLADCEGMVYCQWTVDDSHRLRQYDRSGADPFADRKTMAVRVSHGVITETWQPCDPWLPLLSDVPVSLPNRSDR